jgi:hypothetical protein
VASRRSRPADLKRRREGLIARAALERAALRDATQDFQIATDRVARVAIGGLALIRRYWLPLGVVLAGAFSKRARPVLRMVRTGLVVWQTVKLLRAARR